MDGHTASDNNHRVKRRKIANIDETESNESDSNSKAMVCSVLVYPLFDRHIQTTINNRASHYHQITEPHRESGDIAEREMTEMTKLK